MYTIPNFAGTSGGGASNTMLPSFDSGFAGLPTMGGQNQWGSFPSMGGGPMMGQPGAQAYSASPGMATAPSGAVPPSPGLPLPFQNSPLMPSGPWPTAPAKSAGTGLQGGAATVPSTDPYFTQLWQSMLTGQLGQGVSPFNLSTILPTSGQATAPGSLTAPENPILQSLQNFYQTGQGGPLPGVLPMWTSAMQAMQQPIQQNLASLKEQFASQGALGSSEMATAMANYLQQTGSQEQALLGQMSLQALPGMEQFGGALQNLDQQAIQNMYQEFMRTQPQANPLLSLENQLALSYPPTYGKQGFGASFAGGLGAGLGGGLGQGIGSGAAGLIFGG
jgi:hypothetical protein